MQALRSRVRSGSPDELAAIAQRAQALTNASGTAIALREGNGDEVICRARAGSSAPEVGTALPIEGTFTGLCIQSGTELRCDDAENDPRVDKAATRALGIRSMVAIPIKKEGRVVGVLAVFAPTAHAFRITHVAVLKTMAGQITAYLQRKQRDEAYSPESSNAPPLKAVAVAAAAAPAPLPAVVVTPAEPASAPQELPLAPKVEAPKVEVPVPKVEPVRTSTFARDHPAPLSTEEKTKGHDEQKESKTDFQHAFRTLGEGTTPENRLGAKILFIGTAGIVVIAVAIGLSFKLRRPVAAAQPAPATLRPADTRTAPAPASANAQPRAKDTPLGSPVKREAQPKREETVVLSARPSRISLPQPANSARAGDPNGARDNAAPPSGAPAISLGSMAAAPLSKLAGPLSQPPHPRVLKQSEFEPVTVIKKVAPDYPLVARQRKLSASVVVQGTVNKNGRITDLQLISGPPLFRDAAFEAVKQWVFRPAKLNGQAIEQSTQIRLDFGAR